MKCPHCGGLMIRVMKEYTGGFHAVDVCVEPKTTACPMH